MPARGIGFSEHITFFELTYRGLEKVLLWVLDSETAADIAERLNRELGLLQPFKGLVFSLPEDDAGGVDAAAIRRFLKSSDRT